MDSTDPAKSGVAWVVHFEVPHTAELYIHRSGRTARAHREGSSVLFICPNEMPLWRRLAFSLKRTDFDLPDLPVEPSHFQLVACERIVHLAKQLDLAEHSVKRRAANEVWFTRAARDADIELDSDLEPDKDDKEKLKAEKQIERSQIRRQFNKLRSNLIQLVTECQKSLENKLSNTPNTPVHTTSKAIRSQLKRISKNSKKRSIIPCT
ncbi:hypothetical protein PHET_05809 [Paragonimus heterotremus]|uniref:Helicase C-terminal domain-containing protein n=1 Tax=Paragonimus heterotremus TaxID=100268 RepID=A0A8J4SXN4_9TREM|nr:hypothetical protein PHET_05809 [Paragonimus heterotremus]